MCNPFAAPKMPQDNSAAIARQQEEARQAKILEGRNSIDSAFEQFSPEFYDTQTRAYGDYYNPQLTDHFEKARRKLIYDLSRSGNLNSGAGAKKIGELTKSRDLQRGAISGQALDYGNQIRTNVENARSDLYSQNQASADPSAAASGALARAGALTTPPALSPLGDVFASLIDFGRVGIEQEAKGYPGLRTGLFPADKRSIQIIR